MLQEHAGFLDTQGAQRRHSQHNMTGHALQHRIDCDHPRHLLRLYDLLSLLLTSAVQMMIGSGYAAVVVTGKCLSCFASAPSLRQSFLSCSRLTHVLAARICRAVQGAAPAAGTERDGAHRRRPGAQPVGAAAAHYLGHPGREKGPAGVFTLLMAGYAPATMPA